MVAMTVDAVLCISTRFGVVSDPIRNLHCRCVRRHVDVLNGKGRLTTTCSSFSQRNADEQNRGKRDARQPQHRLKDRSECHRYVR